MEEVRDFLEAVTRQLGDSSHGESSGSRRSGKRKPKFLPSSFLKKNKTTAQKEQEWDKDIICLTKDYSEDEKEIPIPRGALEKRKNRMIIGLMPSKQCVAT